MARIVRPLLLDRSRFCAEKLGDPVVDLNTAGQIFAPFFLGLHPGMGPEAEAQVNGHWRSRPSSGKTLAGLSS